jgi:hypothetical protein
MSEMMCGDARPPELATLAGRVIEAVGSWATDLPPRLPGPLREVMVRELTDLLVDATRRETYHTFLHCDCFERARWRRYSASYPPAELPLGQIATSGLDRLGDMALVALALDPLQLEATAEVVDGLAESGGLGRVWWDAMARAGAAAYPEASGANASPQTSAATNNSSVLAG